MSDTKEYTIEQNGVNYDAEPTSGVHSRSARTSQKLDVKLVPANLCCCSSPINCLKEVPLAETCRRVWLDRLILMDWNQLDHWLRLSERRSDDPRLGNDSVRGRDSCHCGLARRVSFNVGRTKTLRSSTSNPLTLRAAPPSLVLSIDGRGSMHPGP